MAKNKTPKPPGKPTSPPRAPKKKLVVVNAGAPASAVSKNIGIAVGSVAGCPKAGVPEGG
jgi:hypothetical protein